MHPFVIDKSDTNRYPMGLTRLDGGIHVSVVAAAKECSLLLFRHSMQKGKRRKDGARRPDVTIPFPAENRIGNVWEMTLRGEELEHYEYAFEADGDRLPDPYGRRFYGREQWGKPDQAGVSLTTPMKEEAFDWEGDTPPRIPYEDSIVYRAHVRGLTRHASSGVKSKG
ncbi:MAG: alpha-amylase, partial [Clostridiales bacterium]|nr:alpha-amylase [Clostridiales bacterium]